MRIALCDQDSQETVTTRRHNDDIVVACCSAVKELADMYCGGHLAIDQQREEWLRSCFTKLYHLLEYNAEDQQVLANLKLRLPRIGETHSRQSSRGSLSSRTKPTSVIDWREQCRQEIAENNMLKEEIARLQDMQTHMRSEYYHERAPVEEDVGSQVLIGLIRRVVANELIVSEGSWMNLSIIALRWGNPSTTTSTN